MPIDYSRWKDIVVSDEEDENPSPSSSSDRAPGGRFDKKAQEKALFAELTRARSAACQRLKDLERRMDAAKTEREKKAIMPLIAKARLELKQWDDRELGTMLPYDEAKRILDEERVKEAEVTRILQKESMVAFTKAAVKATMLDHGLIEEVKSSPKGPPAAAAAASSPSPTPKNPKKQIKNEATVSRKMEEKKKEVKADVKDMEVTKPVVEAKPVEETKDVGDTKPIEESKAVEETKDVEKTEAVKEARTVEETKPAGEKKADEGEQNERQAAEKKEDEINPLMIDDDNIEKDGEDSSGSTATTLSLQSLEESLKELDSDEQEELGRMTTFFDKYEMYLHAFGRLTDYDNIESFLLENDPLVCEYSVNFLTYEALNLAIDHKDEDLDLVTRKILFLQYLLNAAKEVGRDPVECISSFTRQLATATDDHRQHYEDEVEEFKEHFRQRAKEKKEKAKAELDGAFEIPQMPALPQPFGENGEGKEALAVLLNLPEPMQDAFHKQDFRALYNCSKTMEHDAFAVHFSQCVEAGLWRVSHGDNDMDDISVKLAKAPLK